VWERNAIFGLVMLAAGCATLPSATVQEIDGDEVEFVSIGAGQPVVVFETGMGPTMDTWNPVLEDIAAFTRVFAYNRAGYGRSSARHPPQTASHVAKNLRRNLQHAGHHPPYVLVGHSAGGLYANAFARMYPGDVAGVVLIDSSHPRQFEYLKNEKPFVHTMLMVSVAIGRRSYEGRILQGVLREFETLDEFPNVPLVVLTAEKSSLFETKEMRRQWLAFQQDLAAMSSQSTQKQVEGSFHYIHKSHPELVVRAAQQLVDAARRID